jgi:hypothetical protein
MTNEAEAIAKTTEAPSEPKELLRKPFEIIRDVDMTPDAELPIRIIQAYLTNCKVLFNLDNIDDEYKELCGFLNDNAEKGGRILEKVLAVLNENKDKWSAV